MSKPELPDQFLYSRQGPWPQPSPSHPMICAAEVLNIPPMEELLFNSTISKRYLEAQIGYPPVAAKYATEHLGWTGVTDERFDEMMFTTVYTRYLSPLTDKEKETLKAQIEKDKPGFSFNPASNYGKYDFTAMNLVIPLPNMYCAGVQMIYEQDPATKVRKAIQIIVKHPDMEVAIYPADTSWGIAKLYVMQGASYHVLFVVHPALHFPMDSVNAITKSSVPMAHPLYQLLFPHTSYTLALDHAVLESAESVVNNNAQGTRFDPLTGNGYNLKLLFAAGYTGLSEVEYGNSYQPYQYLKPQMDFDSEYGEWLGDYYRIAFQPFCKVVAKNLLADSHLMEYVNRWADYNAGHVLGFPGAAEIANEDTLTDALAIYMWDTSVAHGGDHDSFGNMISSVEKVLRIRREPPRTRGEDPVKAGQIFTGNDLQRAELANEMFFKPWTIEPNLSQTYYAFTEPSLWAGAVEFHQNLAKVAQKWEGSDFQPLVENDAAKIPYARTISQSIQY